jgi:thioredoxin-like negative regulator of GroEL
MMLFLLTAVALAKIEIRAMDHDVQEVTGRNFDSVVAKFLDSSVASVFFFKPGDAEAEFTMYNEVAKELKGMAKVTAINCETSAPFCKTHDITTTPAVKLFPVNPMPAAMYKGEMKKEKLSKAISKMIPSFATELTAEAADTFLVSEPSKPKVLLFSNKEKVPTILKALSSDSVFKRSIKFAFVKHTEESIVKKLKVKKFPAIVMVRGSKSEIREEYKGDFSFREIHQWVNLYSESGMGDKMAGAGAAEEESAEEARPWLVQEIPELTRDSQADVCFKGEGLCVIYLSDGPAPAADIDMLTTLKGKFTSQLDGRGTTFKWMWIDLKVETEFKALFEPEAMPGVVVFNPHKRLRFTKLEGKTASAQSIRELIDKIQGGDARFTMVKGQKLPKWADRPKGDKKKKGEL